MSNKIKPAVLGKNIKKLLVSTNLNKQSSKLENSKSLDDLKIIEELNSSQSDFLEYSTTGPKMVDITSKIIKQEAEKRNLPRAPSIRTAIAEAFVRIDSELKQLIHSQRLVTSQSCLPIESDWRNMEIDTLLDGITDLMTPKGDAFMVARLAGIQAAKQTSNLIPLCHQIPLSHISLDIQFKDGKIVIQSTTKAVGQSTGVEMEALTAVTIAALTIYDMLKPLQRGTIIIEKIELLEKHGGTRGSYVKVDTPN